MEEKRQLVIALLPAVSAKHSGWGPRSIYHEACKWAKEIERYMNKDFPTSSDTPEVESPQKEKRRGFSDRFQART